jgi:hypothetical protein
MNITKLITPCFVQDVDICYYSRRAKEFEGQKITTLIHGGHKVTVVLNRCLNMACATLYVLILSKNV